LLGLRYRTSITVIRFKRLKLYAVARPSVCLSVTFVRPTQRVEIFVNISTPFGTLTIRSVHIHGKFTPLVNITSHKNVNRGQYNVAQSYEHCSRLGASLCSICDMIQHCSKYISARFRGGLRRTAVKCG